MYLVGWAQPGFKESRDHTAMDAMSLDVAGCFGLILGCLSQMPMIVQSSVPLVTGAVHDDAVLHRLPKNRKVVTLLTTPR